MAVLEVLRSGGSDGVAAGTQAGKHLAYEIDVLFFFVVESIQKFLNEIDMATACQIAVEIPGGGFLFQCGAKNVNGVGRARRFHGIRVSPERHCRMKRDRM